MDHLKTLTSKGKSFWSDQSGATAIEYGLIAAGICLVIAASVRCTGITTSIAFNRAANAVL